MARNDNFDWKYQPFRENDQVQLQHDNIDGPLRSFNPTHATFDYVGSGELRYGIEGSEYTERTRTDGSDGKSLESNVEYQWTSRNNRKGRHALRVHESADDSQEYETPEPTTTPKAVLKGIHRMLTSFAYWDVSFLGAISFVIACVVLVVNAFLSFMPYMNLTPPSGFTPLTAILNCVGCTLFLISSFLSFTEAANADLKGCLGWKMQHTSYTDSPGAMGEQGGVTRIIPDLQCEHHHNNRTNLVEDPTISRPSLANEDGTNSYYTGFASPARREMWRWFPTASELRNHYINDLGFVACSILLGSTILYCCASFIYMIAMLSAGTIEVWIRIPQLTAAIGFAVSSVLFTLETQEDWISPAPHVLGWHIGLWNTIGSVGFLLCATFGFCQSKNWAAFQFAASYLWGSSAFFIGSLIQWYESLDKYPVEFFKKS